MAYYPCNNDGLRVKSISVSQSGISGETIRLSVTPDQFGFTEIVGLISINVTYGTNSPYNGVEGAKVEDNKVKGTLYCSYSSTYRFLVKVIGR